MNTSHEFVIFKFNQTLKLSEQEELMKKIDQCAQKLEGFIKRNYFFSQESNQWIDHVQWETEMHAKSASQKIMEDQNALEVFKHIDESTLNMSHFTQKN